MPAEGFDRALGASYQFEEPIGRGAAGEVWRGIDRRTAEQIAAKLLLRSAYVEDHELVGDGRGSTTGLMGTPEYMAEEAGDALNTFNDRLISAGRVQ